MTEQFITGIVGAPFGLSGFVKVKPLSGEAAHLLKLKSVTLRQDGKDRVFAIEESSPCGQSVAMRFSGFHTPEAAKALSGAQLVISRKEAAPLKSGEFYVEDLKGLEVVGNDGGRHLGHIASIIEGGGGNLAEIRLENGALKLVPFRKEFFSSIDLYYKRATLENLWVLE